MSERLSLNLGIALAIIAAVCAIAFAEQAAAQTTIPAGSVLITPEMRQITTAAGIPSSVQYWDPSNTSVGQTAGEAKLWLQQHATTGANISCLNSQFAEQLEAFMKKEMEAVPGKLVITSGYRSADAQNKLIGTNATRVTTACGSYHVWGLAADFNNNTAQQTAWMRNNVAGSGIMPIGAWDPNHFQSAAGRQGQCGICDANGGADNQANYGQIDPSTLPPSTAQNPAGDDALPPTEGLTIPPGYCLTSSAPLTVVLCSSLGSSTPSTTGDTSAVAPTQPSTPSTAPAQPTVAPDLFEPPTPVPPVAPLSPSGAILTPNQIVQTVIQGNDNNAPAPAGSVVASFFGQSTSIYGQSQIPGQSANLSTVPAFSGSPAYGPTFDLGSSPGGTGPSWVSQFQNVLSNFDNFLLSHIV